MNEPRLMLTENQKIITVLAVGIVYPTISLIQKFIYILKFETNTTWDLIGVYSVLYFAMTIVIASLSCPRRETSLLPWILAGSCLSFWISQLIAMFFTGHWLGVLISLVVGIGVAVVMNAIWTMYGGSNEPDENNNDLDAYGYEPDGR